MTDKQGLKGGKSVGERKLNPQELEYLKNEEELWHHDRILAHMKKHLEKTKYGNDAMAAIKKTFCA